MRQEPRTTTQVRTSEVRDVSTHIRFNSLLSASRSTAAQFPNCLKHSISHPAPGGRWAKGMAGTDHQVGDLSRPVFTFHTHLWVHFGEWDHCHPTERRWLQLRKAAGLCTEIDERLLWAQAKLPERYLSLSSERCKFKWPICETSTRHKSSVRKTPFRGCRIGGALNAHQRKQLVFPQVSFCVLRRGKTDNENWIWGTLFLASSAFSQKKQLALVIVNVWRTKTQQLNTVPPTMTCLKKKKKAKCISEQTSQQLHQKCNP